MTNFRTLYTLTIYSNISKIRILIQTKFCRNASVPMDLAKNNRFSAEEGINHRPCTEKRKKIPVREIILYEFSGSLWMLRILLLKLNIIVHKGRSSILTSTKLELFCQYVVKSWHYIVAKSSIIDDVEVQDPILVCLFSL